MRVGIGGEYYMVSRSLGLELGGAIGIPLFLAQALEEPTRGAITQGPVENHQRGDPRIGNRECLERESRMHLISALSTEIEMGAAGLARESARDLIG